MAVSSFYKSFLGDLPNISFFSPSYTHLINKLKKHKPYSIPFLNPVRKKDAPGYYDIIKKPIDLSTIQKNTENHIYKNKSELFDDLKLMRDNCKTYNISGYIVDYGEEILKYAEKVIFVEDSDNVLEGNVIELEEQSKWSDITDSDLLEMEELYFSNDVDYDVKMDVLSFESENVPTEQIRADNVLIESNLDPSQNVLIESNLDPSQNILIESNLDPSQNILIESNLDPSQN
ncbi:Histone acetyltransferase SAGA/ADA, catalytic subunit PCAF/GCN5, partial [Pseudoloma neurophilia]